MTNQETITAAVSEIREHRKSFPHSSDNLEAILTHYFASKNPVAEPDVEKIANAYAGNLPASPTADEIADAIKQAILEATAPLQQEVTRLTELLNEGVGMRESKLEDDLIALRQKVAELENALEEIAKGEGTYSRDPLIHASNTINAMVQIARNALSTAKEKEGN